jgi:hypothetical protein
VSFNFKILKIFQTNFIHIRWMYKIHKEDDKRRENEEKQKKIQVENGNSKGCINPAFVPENKENNVINHL